VPDALLRCYVGFAENFTDCSAHYS
jgi:hypothetical protein